MSFFSNLFRDIAIDLGTANTLIFIRDKGVVLNEPSIVARERNTGKVVAIGHDALLMHEKTHPGIITIRPLASGVIADYEATEELIKGLIKKTKSQFSFGIRRMVIGIPSGITEVEKRAVRDSAEHVGAKEVFLIAEPMAAAIGIGIDVKEPMGNMIVDIGGGTTEIAVISLGGIASGESLRVAGTDITNAIIRHFRKTYNLAIGERTAEDVKIKIASAYKLEKELTMTVRGRNLVTALPEEREVNSPTIREAIATPISQIIASVKKSLEVTKPELSADILDRGLFLAGGGALIKGLDKKINEETRLAVHISEDPLTAVARGTGEVLENLEKYRTVLLANKRY
ncbi:rod shape-determining protein [Chlorobium phaeobacteroides]|jgi:rod shape-determining protein MreB|uniref:Cell shape-determining protein MreB n=1 Tax=Chlorobium phaeobacteroides (strain DSM 266 / SMG 266 / 2430) TaxID=290317 RepID=A1BEM4_CHLPD|nr:rod shape-determining protein [Chlorobium phaeobacteroides]ABL64851.1 cell shape determining protein, MreB/Mrl family [Chlorobium phaeobacteroides DSM 266]MBV5326726.1 rod shape-determining protein [Chlorobium sp.]